jgi:uncharacterized protein HemX
MNDPKQNLDETNNISSDMQSDLETNSNTADDIQPVTKDANEVNTQHSLGVEDKEKTMGPIVAVVIIIIVLIIGGLYYWGKTINNLDSNVEQNLTAEEIASQPDTTLDKLKTQSTSDQPGDIEADLNATDINGLDIGIDNINTELGI